MRRRGVGALYVRRDTPLHPFVLGAGHEHGLRPGTENVASIVGLGLACELATRDLDDLAARIRHLRDELCERLAAEIPDLRLNGDPVRRLPNTLSVRFPRVTGNEVLARRTDCGRFDGLGVPCRPRERIGSHSGDGRSGGRGAGYRPPHAGQGYDAI